MRPKSPAHMIRYFLPVAFRLVIIWPIAASYESPQLELIVFVLLPWLSLPPIPMVT